MGALAGTAGLWGLGAGWRVVSRTVRSGAEFVDAAAAVVDVTGDQLRDWLRDDKGPRANYQGPDAHDYSGQSRLVWLADELLLNGEALLRTRDRVDYLLSEGPQGRLQIRPCAGAQAPGKK